MKEFFLKILLISSFLILQTKCTDFTITCRADRYLEQNIRYYGIFNSDFELYFEVKNSGSYSVTLNGFDEETQKETENYFKTSFSLHNSGSSLSVSCKDSSKYCQYASPSSITISNTLLTKLRIVFLWEEAKFRVVDGTQTSRILYENDVILKDIIGDFFWLISFDHNFWSFRKLHICRGKLINTAPIVSMSYHKNSISKEIMNQGEYIPADSIKNVFLSLTESIYKYYYDYYTISSNCTGSSIEKDHKKSDGNPIKFTLNCNKVGYHVINFSDLYKNYYTFGFNIQHGDFNSIQFKGYDGDKIISLKGERFEWGSVKGDFKLSDFYINNRNGYLIADFILVDLYGNLITEFEYEENQLIIENEISAKFGVESISFSFSKVKKGNYQFKILVQKPGQYFLSSKFFYHYFIVYDNIPKTSYCEIENYSNEIYNPGMTIKYKCYLYDSFDNLLSPEDGINYFNYTYLCQISDNKLENITLSVEYEKDYFYCNYLTSKNGNFTFSSFYILNEEKNLISPKTNTIKVYGPPTSIHNAKVYSYFDNNWHNNNESIFYKKMDNGEVLALQFFDDEERFIPSGYDYLDLTKLSGNIISNHAPSLINEKLKFSKFMIGENEYILVSIDKIKIDKVFKRTSTGYTCNILYSYDGSSIQIPINIKLNRIGSYTACEHDLSKEKTEYIKYDESEIYKGYANEIIELGKILLKTKDNNVYNYDIPTNRFSFDVEVGVKTVITSDNDIDGLYSFYMKAEKAKNYVIKVKLDRHIFKEIKSEVLPSPIIDKFEPPNSSYVKEKDEEDIYNIKLKYSADDNPKIYFIAKDQYDNNLIYHPSLSNNYLYIQYELKIDDNIYDQSLLEFKYDEEEKKYYLLDKAKLFGNYTIILYSKSNKRMILKYYKSPGKASHKTTTMQIGNNKILQIGLKSTILVELKDEYGNNIALDTNALEKELNAAEFYVTNEKGIPIPYKLTENSELILKYITTSSINQAGLYNLIGKIYGEEIKNCLVCSFNSVFNEFDIYVSKLYMLQRDFIELDYSTIFRLNNFNRDLIFKFDFMNSRGERIKQINSNIDLNLEIKTPNGYLYTLRKEVSTLNSFFFHYNQSSLKNGQYELSIILDNKRKKSYKLQLLDEEFDDNENSNYSIENTFVSKRIINSIAGTKQLITLELRTSENKRLANNITKSKTINITNKDISYSVIPGNKLGKYIIELSSEKGADFENAHQVDIYFDEEIITKVNLTVSPNKLYKFEVDNSSIINDNRLKSGNTNIIPQIILIPFDKYDNIIEDIFDSDIYPSDILVNLFNIESEYPVKMNVFANSAQKKILIQLSTNYAQNITIKSIYLQNDYIMEINSGEISSKSTGFIALQNNDSIKSGTPITFEIIPRDNYGNVINYQPDKTNFVLNIVEPNNDIEKPLIEDFVITTDDHHLQYSLVLNKTGKNKIKAYYIKKEGDQIIKEEIINYNNIINVKNADIDFTKTKIKYNNVLYSQSDLIQIPKSNFPLFYVQIYDINDNPIEDPSSIIIETNFFDELHLCQHNYNSYKLLSICEVKVEDWISQSNEVTDGILLIKYNDINIEFSIKLTGSVDHDISDEIIDFSKTLVSTSSLNIIAGEMNQMKVTLKTVNDLRKKPDINTFSKFNIEILKSEKQEYSYQIVPGGEIGSYIILFNITKVYNKEDNNFMIIKYGEDEIPTKILIVVSPSIATKGYILNKYGKKANTLLDDAIADKKHSLRILFEDKYGNAAVPSVDEFTYEFYHEINPNQLIESSSKLNYDGSITLNLFAIYAGLYKIKSHYFTYVYEINSKAGSLSEENTYFEVNKSAIAGDKIEIYVMPYDKYKNYINFEHPENLFKIYYRYKIDDEEKEFGNYLQVNYTDRMTEINGLKVFVYEATLKYKGINEFIGFINSTEKVIKCSNCFVDVQPKNEMNFEKSDVYRYVEETGKFELLIDGDYEINFNSNMSIRIYPRDEYGNLIKTVDKNKNYNANLKDYYNFYTNINDEYIEFISKNETYNQLEGGLYNLEIFEEEKVKSYDLYLSGPKNTEYYNNNNFEASKTLITNENLNYIAGDIGFIITLLRNENGLPMSQNDINIGVESCENNSDFKYEGMRTNSPYVLIFINSTKSNTYPKESNCELTLTFNGVTLSNKPNIRVKPSDIDYAIIDPDFIQSETNLTPTNADLEFKFKVIAKDLFNNTAKPKDSLLKIQIFKNKIPIETLTSSYDVDLGEQIYISTLKLEGTYQIKAGTNDNEKPLFRYHNESEEIYSVYNSHGSINSETTDVKVLNISLYAGNDALIKISAYDQYKNPIHSSEDLNLFYVYLTKESNTEKIDAIKDSISDNNIIFKNRLEVKGVYNWNIEMNNISINCFGCETDVYPSNIEPSKTLIYGYDINYQYKEFELRSGNPVYSSQDYPLNLYLILRDKYKNVIDSINGTETSIENIIFKEERRDLEKEVHFNSTVSNDLKRILIFLNDSTTNIHNFNHLVELDNSNYTLSFNLIYLSQNQRIQLNVIHKTNKNDTFYGNGYYDPEKTIFEKIPIKIRAGELGKAFLTLRTEDEKIYNDDVEEGVLTCNLADNIIDESFTCNIEKTSSDYGKYTMTLSSIKVNSNLDIIVNIKKPNEKYNDFNISMKTNITVGLPDINQSMIPTFHEKLKISESFKIYFELKDKYRNTYNNNREPITNGYIKFLSNSKLIDAYPTMNDFGQYEVSYKFSIPPRKINFQILYIDESNTIILNPNGISFTIISDVFWPNTQISGTQYSNIKAGNSLVLNAYLYDESKNCIEEVIDEQFSAKITGPLESGSSSVKTVLFQNQTNEQLPSCQIYYSLDSTDHIFTNKGTYQIEISHNGFRLNHLLKVVPGNVDKDKFIVEYNNNDDSFNNNKIKAGTLFNFTITGKDTYENEINYEIGKDVTVKIYYPDGNELESEKYLYSSIENSQNLGKLKCSLLIKQTGPYVIKYFYLNQLFLPIQKPKTPENIIIVSGKCSSETSIIYSNALENKTIGQNLEILIQCLDIYNNNITEGGESFTSTVYYSSSNSSQTTPISSFITDNMNGTYTLTFYPPLVGYYSFSLNLDDKIFYIDPEKTFFMDISDCEFKCPDGKCVTSARECIHPNCSEDKPIYCEKENKCVVSATQCECETGYTSCDINNYHICVKTIDGIEECPFVIPINCPNRYPNYPIEDYDGICRKYENQAPNPRVCPLGYVLCADFSCRENLNECANYDKCNDDQIKCLDQTCVSDQKDCPSQISCGDPSKFVCPDGSCVNSELECKVLPTCPSDAPILCPNYACVSHISKCTKNPACGHGKTLCFDYICREKC